MSTTDAPKTLALAGSLDKPLRWMLALGAIPLLGVIAGMLAAYPHVPAHQKAPLLATLIATPLILSIALTWLLRSLRRAGVQIDRGDLVIATGLGTKRIALSNLRARGLQLVDLTTSAALRPMLRLWGTGLPGFAGGWFRLRNGEKALCLLLDRRRVSYLRSESDNLSLLLSLAEPDSLRALLQR